MMPASTWCSLNPLVVVVVAVFVACQQPGSNRPENHPALIIQSCTKNNGCKDEAKHVVLDANFRTVYSILVPEQYCVLFNKWNTSVCPNGPTCAHNCALDGADNYEIYHRIKASGSSLTLAYATYLNHFFNIGSRVFLMDDDSKYKIVINERDTMAPAAKRWTFGKTTQWPPHTLLTSVLSLGKAAVKELLVEVALDRGTREFVTKMVATSIFIDWVTKLSLVLVK